MKMLPGTQQLLHKWEAGGMEEEGCRCGCEGGAEAGFHLQEQYFLHLRQKEIRRRRMAQVLSAVLLVLLSALAGLMVVLYGRQCSTPPDSQTTNPPDSRPSDADRAQQQVGTPKDQDVFPRALLTAPFGNISNGKYLQWEPSEGNAYCKGFNYSNGEVVIPRDGYYRISLQVTYQGETEKGRLVTLKSSVLHIRGSYSSDRYLLTSQDMVMGNGGIWTKSLHTSGVFHLMANGRLRVNSTQESLIRKAEHVTFFAVELQTNS